VSESFIPCCELQRLDTLLVAVCESVTPVVDARRWYFAVSWICS